ncbi:MAG TPA: fumarate hydratase [Terriglobales bacterium]|nr:fumarate hydratase [Terriglobales bacterium]
MGFSSKDLQPVLYEMLDRITTGLPNDILSAIKEAHARETKDLAKKQLEAILNSSNLSTEEHLPLCQDTGLVTVFVSGDLMGQVREVEEALTAAIQDLTSKGGMRANVVNPLTRKNTGTNTGLNQPEVLLDKSNPQTTVRMILKGAGSENFTNLKMMVPTASRQDMLKHILSVVIEAGGKTCPPNILGIGIGGSAIQAMFNSKLALLREVGSRNPDPDVAKFENSIVSAANELGIGTMGLGGDTTILDAHIETAGTHTACLPIAISFGCWANRVSVAELKDNQFKIVR